MGFEICTDPWESEPATKAQLDLIGRIDDLLGTEFGGSTKREASDHIDAHLERYAQERDLEDLAYECMMESRHGAWGCRDE